MKVFDSMEQAAAAMKIDMALIKRAKRAGCPNFKGSRIIEEGLQKWIGDHEGDLTIPDEHGLKEQKLKEEVRKLRRLNDIQEGKLVAKTAIAASVQRVMSGARPFLEAKLVNEYPSAVAGLDVPQARVYGRRLFDSIMNYFQSLCKEFPE